MKNITYQLRHFVFLAFTVLGLVSCAKGQEKSQEQQTKAPKGSPIVWESSVEAAFTKAKEQNLPVFIECYHPTCPICMALEPTLKKPEVGDFYNQNFVNVKLDLSNAEMVKFLDGKKIYLPSFPMFLYFDNDQNIIHQSEPVNTVENIVKTGKAAIDPNQQVTKFWDMYQKGNREVNLLTSLASFLRVTRDTTRNIQVANDLFAVYPKAELGTEAGWAITKKCVMDVDNGFAQYWFDHVPQAAQYEAKAGHKDGETNALGMIIQTSIFSARGNNYSTAQIAKIKTYMQKIGAGQYADGATWQQEAKALVRENNAAKALTLIDGFAKKFSTNGQSLVFLTKFSNDLFKDQNYVTLAKSWLQKATPLLKEKKDLAELHFEAARLAQKANDKATAQKELTLAIQNATAAGLDMTRFTNLQASFK